MRRDTVPDRDCKKQVEKQAAKSIVIGQSLRQAENTVHKWLFLFGNQRHVQRALAPADCAARKASYNRIPMAIGLKSGKKTQDIRRQFRYKFLTTWLAFDR
jgi:hypothetical protein